MTLHSCRISAFVLFFFFSVDLSYYTFRISFSISFSFLHQPLSSLLRLINGQSSHEVTYKILRLVVMWKTYYQLIDIWFSRLLTNALANCCNVSVSWIIWTFRSKGAHQFSFGAMNKCWTPIHIETNSRISKTSSFNRLMKFIRTLSDC